MRQLVPGREEAAGTPRQPGAAQGHPPPLPTVPRALAQAGGAAAPTEPDPAVWLVTPRLRAVAPPAPPAELGRHPGPKHPSGVCMVWGDHPRHSVGCRGPVWHGLARLGMASHRAQRCRAGPGLGLAKLGEGLAQPGGGRQGWLRLWHGFGTGLVRLWYGFGTAHAARARRGRGHMGEGVVKAGEVGVV